MAAFMFCATSAVGSERDGRRPNVLLIITDDQGYGDISSHGNKLIETPAMDRLASEGARFDRFFVSPVCAPTRAALLTGRYYLRTGVHGVTGSRETMRAGEWTLAELLKSHGYATGCFGKWHNGSNYPHNPLGQGFDEFLGFCAGHWNNYFDTTLEHNGKPVQTEGYITDVLTDAALDFIEKNKANPFFCYVPYNAPHSPWQVPDRYFDKYKAKGLDDETACSYGMIESVDDNMARLLQALDKHGLAEDTVVIFLTDNGPNTERYNAGMKGRKGSSHEGGVRVPCFVRWKSRINPGTVVAPLAADIDILPTVAALCGLPMNAPTPVDGIDFSPWLKGESRQPLARTLFNHWSGNTVRRTGGAVRTDRWRAVNTPGGWELYDMTHDPGQSRDVAAQHPQELSQLTHAYEAWYTQVTRDGYDPIPIELGHLASPRNTLYAPTGQLHGEGIQFSVRSGWANSWVTNWTGRDSYISWEVNVVRAGRYHLAIQYCVSEQELGSKVRVELAGRSLDAIVNKAHDPPLDLLQDRVPRNESGQKNWATMEFGELELPAGQTRLMVKTTEIAKTTPLQLKAVEVAWVNP